MVFTNAINNQIPNSVLVPEGFNTFNRSQQRQAEINPIYTGPGTMPVELPEYSAKYDPYVLPKAVLTGVAAPALGTLIGGPALGLAPGLIDIGLMTARGLGKAASIIPGLGPEFAKGVERTIPEPFVARTLQNIAAGGNRQQMVEQVGELPFMTGDIVGNLGSAVSLASAPRLGKLFDVGTDILGGTPGATGFLAGAKTPGQMLARGATVGAYGSVLPAIDVAYNAQQGIIDPLAGLGTLGFGTALGAAVPALMIGAARGKQVLNDITQAVRKRIANSDAIRTEQQVAQRNMEAQQAQQMAVQKQMEQMPFEDPVEAQAVAMAEPLQPFERQGVPEPLQPNRFNYDAEGNPIPKTKADTVLDEVTLNKDISTETYTNDVAQMEKDLDYVAKEITNLRKKKVTLTKDEYQQEKALYKQLRDKEKEYGINRQVQQTAEERYLNYNEKYEEIQKLKAQADEFRTSRITEREQARIDELAVLEQLGDELLIRHGEMTTKYKQEQEYLGGLQQMAAQEESRYLPVLSRQEPQINPEAGTGFILNRKGEEPLYSPRPGEETSIVEDRLLGSEEIPVETPIVSAEKTQAEAAPKATKAATTEAWQQAGAVPGASVEEKIRYSAKNSVNRISPITNMISRLNKKVGAVFNDFAVRPGIYKNEFLNQLKPLVDVVKKYAKDPTVMKNLGNVNRIGYEALPQDLAQALKAAQPVFRNEAEALNKKGMDISLTDEIYFPRGWNNIDELQTRLGTITQRESEFRNAPIAMKNRMLSRELEKSKTIPEVTDDIVDLFDPMQGIANWIENTAEKKAEVDLFGNATGKYEENISNLLLKNKDDFKSPQDIQKTMDIMIKAFESQNISSSSPFKLYSGLGSAAIFTGDTTALSQFNDVFLSMARNGLLNSFSGIAQTITSLFPGYKGPMKDILKRTGMSESVAAYTDIGQLDKFADFFGLLKKKQFAEATGAAAGNAGLALNKVNFWRTRITDAIGKKGNLIGRHERLKNNPDLIWDDINEFQPDSQKQQEIFNYYKDLKDNYKTAKYKSMPSDVVAYLLNSGLKYHVKTQFDRNIGSITGNDLERMANFTMSFANKFAATLKDDFAKLGREAITTKNPAKTAKKLLEAAAGASIVIGGGITLALMKGGYNIGFGEEGLPTTPEAIQKAGVEFMAGSAVPMETRLVKSYQGIKGAKAPDSKTAAVVNSLFPGLPTASKAYADAIQTFSEGGLADVYNPNLNPSFRYMPPRIVTDYLYSQSDEFKRNMAKKSTQLQVQPYQEQKTIDDLITRAGDVLQYKSVLDPENVKLVETREVGSNAYKTGLKRLEEEKTNLGTYGTNDPQTVANAQTQKLLADAQITRKIQIAIDAFNDGAISKQEYLALRNHYKAQQKAWGVR